MLKEDKIFSIIQIREKMIPIFEKYGIDCAYLFGSYARGEANEKSDIDICIKPGRVRGFIELNGMEIDLENVTKKKIDILLNDAVKDYNLAQNLYRDKVFLYKEGGSR